MMRRLVLLTLLAAVPAHATQYVVAASGGDFTSVQAALDVALAGDTILVHAKPTPYVEKIAFPRSGAAAGGFITLQAYPGERPVLDGTGVAGQDMVVVDTKSWVKIAGFEIRNDLGVTDGSGIRVLGSGSNVEIRDNDIHDIRGRNAMGITVYATDPATPVSQLVIDGNTIHDCDPLPSEALTLNGNVTDFQVTNNTVRDVNNIGIDFIGGERDIQPDTTKVARNGVCSGNHVFRAREGGGGYAGGIYVDGGQDIVIENNVVSECDLGIEVGAENHGIVASGIVVRDNLVYANEKAGMVFGGYRTQAGRVRNCTFRNNTCWQNDTLASGFGELWIQYADTNEVKNNIFSATSQGVLISSDAGNVSNVLDYNLWYAPGTAHFTWNGTAYTGFAAYRSATGEDAHSPFAVPQLASPGGADFHLLAISPAIDAGDPAFVPAPGEVDLDGAPRVRGPRVDIGADEGCSGCC